ncbi:MAG: TrkH family potassium uptake protein [Clostridiales bacterium]|nr:TrkH family potassium uptake protein [Clostridiales bacterium]
MSYGIVLKVLGSILTVESALMLPALAIAFYTNGHDRMAFLTTVIITGVVGFIISKKTPIKNNVNVKEGLAIVALGWILASLFGALPFYLSGSIPSYVDAVFETVSGFTTTGASILSNVEGLPHGILFWRSFTHWIGGMGILVFTIALLPVLGIGGFQIFKAESPGPTADKIMPRIKDTAKILYTTYFSITVLQVVLLKLGGMNLFDSMLHTFGTVGTGGFGIKNNSVAFYNSTYIHIIIGTFMLLSGINFSLYYSLFKGRWKDIFKNEELRLYLSIVLIAIIAITINLAMTSYAGIFRSLRDSFFQVSSIITTTGYTTANFDAWPSFSKIILFTLMFIGGCAGSTAGGIKVVRILILIKLIKRDIAKLFHPSAFISIKNSGKKVTDETIMSINGFFILYIMIFVISTIIISLEGLDIVSTSSAVAATLGNIGPGLGFVGPANNFGGFSPASKILFSFLMLLGRLEIFTSITLVLPKNWTREI